MILTYTHPNGLIKRLDSDNTAAIAVAASKGYVLTPEPEPEPMPESARIAQIKGAAHAHITASLPEWKQRNLTARQLELVKKRLLGQSLSTDEQGQEVAIEAVWAWVKSVRAESDRLEADNDLNTDDANWPVWNGGS
tara:strand:+ start:1845 stop:2255 length:411 start_codon:yes stop_codon:yes gene_type:complete